MTKLKSLEDREADREVRIAVQEDTIQILSAEVEELKGVIVLFLFCPVSLPICAMRVHTSLPSRSTFLIFPIHADTKSRKGSIGTYETTTTCDYRFLRRPRDSKLSILDEVVAVFHLTTPQFLTLHPPLVNSRSLMAQFAATKTIQRLLKLLKWNMKTNGKRTNRISALDRNQDLDRR